MKDFRFRNQSGTIRVTYRTDAISNTDQNFTVLSISGLNPQDSTNTFKEKKLENAFKRLPYNVRSFVQFAVQNDLELVRMNPDGSGLQVLAVLRDESSYSESTSF